MPLEMRLSPRCIMAPTAASRQQSSGASSCGSSIRGSSVSSPFGHSLNSSSIHSRQSSAFSNLSSSASSLVGRGQHHLQQQQHQYCYPNSGDPVPVPPPLHPHSRQSSSSSSTSKNTLPPLRAPPPRVPPRATVTKIPPPFHRKLSPTSLDMGYHTMATTGMSDSDFDSPSSPLTSLDVSPSSTTSMRSGTERTPLAVPAFSAAFSPFDLLSDDLVVSILSHLPADSLCATAQVCRRFYFLSWDPKLWRSLKLGPSATLDADNALEKLLTLVARHSGSADLRSATPVEKLELNGCSRLTDHGLARAASRCPALRRVELRGCARITGRGVFAGVAAVCPQLEYLDASGNNNESYRLRCSFDFLPISTDVKYRKRSALETFEASNFLMGIWQWQK